MIRKLFCVLLSLFFVIPQMIAVAANEEVFHTIPVPRDVSWMSYALYREGEKIESSGADTAPIGSVSKTYTAAMIMLLAEEGRLSLDEALYQYLPQFTMRDKRYRDITLRMLLNHTAGLYGSTLKNTMLYGEDSRWNHDHFLSMLSEQTLKHAPGAMASYSNDGYTLLELVIEAVTGKSYADCLKERVF